MGKQAGSARPKEVRAEGQVAPAAAGEPQIPKEASSALVPAAQLFLAPCLHSSWLLEPGQRWLCGPPGPQCPVSPVPH